MPTRSTNRPTIGARPNMPRMCTAITKAERSACPWSFMWAGVIAITDTIAAWAPAIDASPRTAPGDRRITPYDAFTCRSGRGRSACGLVAPSTTSGSGRKRANMTAALTRNSAAPNTYGPTSSSRPTRRAKSFSNGVKIGPNTAPIVPTHTIAAIDLARCVGRGEVGTHVATLQRRRLTGAEQRHPDHEQREPAQLPAGAGHDRTQRTDEEGGDEPGPAAVPAHVCGQRDRGDRRAHRERRARQTGEAVAAEQVTRQQRDDGDRRGDGSLTGNLRPPERVQRAAVQHPEVVGGDRRRAHRCGFGVDHDSPCRSVLSRAGCARSGRCASPRAWRCARESPHRSTVPPPLPPSGPRSMIQSAVLITSRLCSMTSTVFPCSTSRESTVSRRRTSSKCSPVVGSSSR